MSWMSLTTTDGTTLPAYLQRPERAPLGAVVVLQEIFGVNAHIREVVQGFAADGYVALAPALFQRLEPGVDLGYDEADRQRGMALKAAAEALPTPGVLDDVLAAVDWARAQQVGPVAVVGYCWGGLLAWRAAALLSGVAAAVPYYGGGMTSELERQRQPRCPVLAHFAEQDPWIPMDTVRAFQQAQPAVQVQLYDAQHGFHCDHRPAWHAPSAALAQQRTLDFLARVAAQRPARAR
jgi:carboxymethylenebutenolidase